MNAFSAATTQTSVDEERRGVEREALVFVVDEDAISSAFPHPEAAVDDALVEVAAEGMLVARRRQTHRKQVVSEVDAGVSVDVASDKLEGTKRDEDVGES